MLNLNQVNKRSRAIKKQIGIKNKNSLDYDNVYCLYINPSNGNFTGVMDNERDVFYEFKNPEDIRKFIGVVNMKEHHFTQFMQVIEMEFKAYIDREITYHEKINELESEIKRLKENGEEGVDVFL